MKRQTGFSLVEMALVLVIVGLLLGGLMTPLAAQFEQRRRSETVRTLEDAREALLGFALRNGYLPCPAVSASNGLEDRSGAHCTGGKRVGFLPWATLGVPAVDGWGRLLRYSVTPAFSQSQPLFGLATPRDITLATRDAQGRLVAASAVQDVPAVVLSHGPNGVGGTAAGGVPVAAAPAGEDHRDERINAAANGIAFVTRPPGAAGQPGGAYDDLLTWISPNVLFSRMVAAGVLPH